MKYKADTSTKQIIHSGLIGLTKLLIDKFDTHILQNMIH